MSTSSLAPTTSTEHRWPAPAVPRRRRLVSLRIVGKLLTNALAVVLAAVCLGYGLLFAFRLAPLVMLTGSMGTTIPPGSLVVDRPVPPSKLKVGDVISFQKPIGSHGIDTHRIVAIKRSNAHVAYRTKGDANAEADPWAIEFRPGIKANRVVFSIPYLGWGLLYLRIPLLRTLILAAVLLTMFSSFLKALAADGAERESEKRENMRAPAELGPAAPSFAVAARELASSAPTPQGAIDADPRTGERERSGTRTAPPLLGGDTDRW